MKARLRKADMIATAVEAQVGSAVGPTLEIVPCVCCIPAINGCSYAVE